MNDPIQLSSQFLADRARIQRTTRQTESAGSLARRAEVAASRQTVAAAGANTPTTAAGTTAGIGRAAAPEDQKLREVAEEFESLFLKQMLDTMRSTLNKDNRLVDTGMAGEIFEDMLYEEYSKIMSKRGTFGIAELIVDQFRDSASS